MNRYFGKMQMQRMERAAVGQGSSMARLMELAGKAAVEHILRRGDVTGRKFAILCGRGNNGGDGFVAARLLSRRGARVAVILAEGFPGTDLAKDAYGAMGPNVNVIDWQNQQDLCRRAVQGADWILDCLYGFSFHGELREPALSLIAVANAAPGRRLSLDLPSGVECDTGHASEGSFQAHETVAFSAPKIGHALYPGSRYAGRLTVEEAGIPQNVLDECPCSLLAPEESDIRAHLPRRDSQANKGDFGRLLCVCGSPGMAGAAMMCGRAALRSGAGLVEMALPEMLYPIAAGQLWESVFTPYPILPNGDPAPAAWDTLWQALSRASAVVVGCGLGRSEQKTALVRRMVREYPGPMVIDADGLRALEGDLSVLLAPKGPRVLTPHPGEMGGLIGQTAGQVQNARLQTARDFAAQYPDVVLVLKGAGTLVAHGSDAVCLNQTGNAGMARGGSGDMLAGMIGALLAQGMEPRWAAVCGVYLHGLCGDVTARDLSQMAMLPTDMIERLPDVMAAMEKGVSPLS